MVTTQNENEEQITKTLNSEINIDEIEFTDTISDRSSINSDQNGLDICATNENLGNFGKIVVQNSSDVHFGNKTFYQGPVTIKQFLYNNSISDTKLCVDDGHENPDCEVEYSGGSSSTLDNGIKSCGTPKANGYTKGQQLHNLVDEKGKCLKIYYDDQAEFFESKKVTSPFSFSRKGAAA